MKSKDQGAKLPVPAPEGWPNASLDSIPHYLVYYRPWLEEQALRRGLSTQINLHIKSPQRWWAALVLLWAKAGYLEDENFTLREVLKDHNIQTRTPRSLWNTALRDAAEWAIKQPPKWGDWRTTGYAWLALEHRGADLRAALGYGERRFSKLARKFSRSAIRVAGRDRFYPRGLALDLLAHRLGTTAVSKRAKIAQEIWDRSRGLTKQRLRALRFVLSKAGAKCDLPPAVDFPAGALGGF
jgi:hypothetical protein